MSKRLCVVCHEPLVSDHAEIGYCKACWEALWHDPAALSKSGAIEIAAKRARAFERKRNRRAKRRRIHHQLRSVVK